jgi:Domain of unknown function (DUF1707)
MNEPAGGILASDADRDAAADALADAVASGRLSLAEHSARLDAVFAAATAGQLVAVTADLPARPGRRGALFRVFDPYRGVVIGGRARRAGRFRVGRFCTLTVAFGQLELDLRAARLSQDEVTVTVMGVAARVSVIVPSTWRVTDQLLVLGRRSAIAGADTGEQAPLLRVRGAVVGGSFRLAHE